MNIEELSIKFQQLQQQLQSLMMQKENMRLQVFEIENALKELEGCKEDVYKSSGVILVKETPSKVKKDLEEKMDALNIRIKSFDKKEESFKSELQQVQEELLKSFKANEKAA